MALPIYFINQLPPLAIGAMAQVLAQGDELQYWVGTPLGNKQITAGSPLEALLRVAYHPANPYTVAASDQLLVLNVDNHVANLPPATGSGTAIAIRVEDPSTVANIYPNGTDTIDGGAPGAQLQVFIGNPYARVVDVAPGVWLTGP